jgi:hypothetical protein
MRCKTWVGGRSIARVAGPNPANCLDVFVVCCVGNCDELITRSEVSYQMCVSNCVWSADIKNEAS